MRCSNVPSRLAAALPPPAEKKQRKGQANRWLPTTGKGCTGPAGLKTAAAEMLVDFRDGARNL